MATMVKPKFREESWSYRNGNFIDGAAVRCKVYLFEKEERTLVEVKIDPQEEHGWTTAASDYYYYVIAGRAMVYIDKNEAPQIFHAGESFEIKAGTVYNYRAGDQGLSCSLFMNNLWIEE